MENTKKVISDIAESKRVKKNVEINEYFSDFWDNLHYLVFYIDINGGRSLYRIIL
jgi:hypothetical protein